MNDEMATGVGVGGSRVADSLRAGQEAAGKALASMGSGSPDLVLVFASVRYDQEALLKGVISVTGQAPVVGCSTAGEILPEGPSRRSVAVMAIRSDTLKVATGLGVGVKENPRRAGREVATQVARVGLSNPRGFLMWPDGISGNVAEVIQGVQDVLGLSFPIAGGSAADDFAFKRTYQHFQGRVFTNAVVGVLLAGPIGVAVGARHGWQPLGKPRRVTKAQANVVQELDGQKAVNLYEEYFGKGAAGLTPEELAKVSIRYPLGFSVPGEEEYLLRNALGMDSEGNLIFSGEVPEGADVRLMMGSKQRAMEAARRAAQQASLGVAPDAPRLGLVFSCISRAQLFGRSFGAEVAAIRRELGEAVPLAGFYDYGEQAPLSAAGFRGRSYLHNESVVVVAVSVA